MDRDVVLGEAVVAVGATRSGPVGLLGGVRLEEPPVELQEFCRREHPRLLGALTLYTGDVLLAEELAQEALLAACRGWRRVSRMEAPGAWVHRAAMNMANSRFRRRGAERRALNRRGGEIDGYALPDIAELIDLRLRSHSSPLSSARSWC